MACFFDLKGKTILITGASSGIGRTCAIVCSKMGASVVITGRSKEKLENTFSNLIGDNNMFISADLSDLDSIKDLINQLPALDGVVHCAGQGFIAPIPFCDRKKILSHYEINLFPWMEISRLLYKNKKIKSGGSLIAISSISSSNLITYGNAIYGSAKAALESWCKYCALEFSKRKIRVNTISPGMIDTPLIHSTEISEEQLKANMTEYPLGRYGIPEDVAMGAVYLLSDASKWVTGINLVIDGGVSLK